MSVDRFAERGVVAKVFGELAAMRDVGMNVPEMAEVYVRENEQTLQSFRDNAMKV